jgi:hypothetical protein
MRLWPAPGVLFALLCSGCAADTSMGARALSVQHQYDHLGCDALANGVKGNEARIKELRGLIAKAERESAGSMIGAAVYRPQLAQSQADLKIHQETMEQKGCPRQP